MLIQFRDGRANVANEMHNALATADTEAVRNIAHAIKGMAGNLGADSLYSAAEALENSSKNAATSQLEPLAKTFSTALTAILAALEGLDEVDTPAEVKPSSEPVQSGQVQIDTESMTQLLNELAGHLEGFSLETGPLMKTIHERLLTTHAEPALLEMEKHMQGYDFKSSRQALDSLAALLKISLGT